MDVTLSVSWSRSVEEKYHLTNYRVRGDLVFCTFIGFRHLLIQDAFLLRPSCKDRADLCALQFVNGHLLPPRVNTTRAVAPAPAVDVTPFDKPICVCSRLLLVTQTSRWCGASLKYVAVLVGPCVCLRELGRGAHSRFGRGTGTRLDSLNP